MPDGLPFLVLPVLRHVLDIVAAARLAVAGFHIMGKMGGIVLQVHVGAAALGTAGSVRSGAIPQVRIPFKSVFLFLADLFRVIPVDMCEIGH
jgi:hypothetical protein